MVISPDYNMKESYYKLGCSSVTWVGSGGRNLMGPNFSSKIVKIFTRGQWRGGGGRDDVIY